MLTLKSYFNELLNEFNSENNFSKSIEKRLSLILRESFIPNPSPNFNRYKEGLNYSSTSRKYLDTDSFSVSIIEELKKLNRFNDIFNFIIENNYSPFTTKTIEQDLNSFPSVTRNIISGFITRVYELMINEFKDLNSAFNQTFDELERFLSNDYVTVFTLINLYGPTGSINEIELCENVKIKKADYKIVSQFSLLYNDINLHHTEIFENDYYIEIKHNFLKKDYLTILNNERELI
jgi:HAMP domain-containing protein